MVLQLSLSSCNSVRRVIKSRIPCPGATQGTVYTKHMPDLGSCLAQTETTKTSSKARDSGSVTWLGNLFRFLMPVFSSVNWGLKYLPSMVSMRIKCDSKCHAGRHHKLPKCYKQHNPKVSDKLPTQPAHRL
jgi:hypothetical protein